MELDHIVEEYIACVFIETVRYVLNRLGKIDKTTGETYEVSKLISIAFALESDPDTGKTEPMRSPLFRALFCLAIVYTQENMRERRRKRKLK